jgi:rhamnulokinase
VDKPIKMLAFDLGASSGRAILGIFDGEKLVIEEIHRFPNDPVEVGTSLYWDILRLFHEIKQGILKCVNSGHRDISSIAVDTWGVDFGLLDERGDLIANPFHYRDSRTNGIPGEVFKIIPKEELYSITGTDIMKINSLFQLYSLKLHAPSVLSNAKTLLFTPDLLNYFLTGEKFTEYSIASTSQMIDAAGRDWSAGIIKKLGLPRDLFTKIIPSGSIAGMLSDRIAGELGIKQIPVAAVAGHDTQAAIAAIPAGDGNFIYISCGTWSLMGVEADHPVINEKSRMLAFTNEGGVGDRITFHKNIMGLWLLQECKRQWEKEGKSFSFAELEDMANSSEPFKSFIDPDDDEFSLPGNMPVKIADFCKRTEQPVPQNEGEIVICIAQSLALKYRQTLENLEDIFGKSFSVVNMVGGGIKDRLLCQFTANATVKRVCAGPAEATAIGNLLLQAMALGELENLEEIRRVVKNSVSILDYEPENVEQWEEAYINYKRVVLQLT